MVRNSSKIGIVVLVVLLVALLAACGGDGDEESPPPMAQPSSEPTMTQELTEPVVITIGNLTDITGVSANVSRVTDMALEDMVEYYNKHNLVPGVELEVITYDGAYDPSKDIPGYEWLKGNGADLIWTVISASAVTIKPFLEEDEIVLFSGAADEEELITPPGCVFAPGVVLGRDLGYTLLKGVTENDPDFPQDRPAKVGGAVWAETYSKSILAGVEEYAKAHPEQFEWEGGYMTNFSFIWSSEVEALKDCDYVLPPIPMQAFVGQYRDTDYSAKFIGTIAHSGFLGLIDDAGLWDEIDGMIVLHNSQWWNEEGDVIGLTKNVLNEIRPDEAEDIIRMGSGYLIADQVRVMIEIIREAVEAVGPENFNTQSIYDAAESFSLSIDGVELDSFSETKRTSRNYFRLYEYSATDEGHLSGIGPEWYPVAYAP